MILCRGVVKLSPGVLELSRSKPIACERLQDTVVRHSTRDAGCRSANAHALIFSRVGTDYPG